MCAGEFYAPQGFGHGTNLVQLDKDGICDAFTNSFLEDLRIRYKNIVANQLNFVAKALRERLPPCPIVLSQAVLERKNLRITFDPVGPELDHLFRTLAASSRLVKDVSAVFV